MKRFLSLLMATLTITSMFSVFASEINQDTAGKTGSTIVKYTIGEAYTITIPPEMVLKTDTEITVDDITSVKAANVKVANGKELVVSMESANDYNLVFEQSSIEYWAKQGASKALDAVADEITNPVLTVQSGTTTGETFLKFYTTDDAIAAATQAGEHKDTLTFTCEVKDI